MQEVGRHGPAALWKVVIRGDVEVQIVERIEITIIAPQAKLERLDRQFSFSPACRPAIARN